MEKITIATELCQMMNWIWTKTVICPVQPARRIPRVAMIVSIPVRIVSTRMRASIQLHQSSVTVRTMTAMPPCQTTNRIWMKTASCPAQPVTLIPRVVMIVTKPVQTVLILMQPFIPMHLNSAMEKTMIAMQYCRRTKLISTKMVIWNVQPVILIRRVVMIA